MLRTFRPYLVFVFSLICFLFCPFQSYGQTEDQKLYRLYVDDFKRIQKLESTGISIYNLQPNSFVEIMALPEQAEQLKQEGFEVVFLANKFSELAELSSLKASPEYHDYQETIDELNDLATRFPDITRLSKIGESVLGRDILCIKVSDNPDVDEDEVPIFIVGAHHGNEVLTVEATLYQLNYLLDNYGTDNEVSSWIDNYEIWFVPLMNPDGREAVRRTNENNVDLNRNYSYKHTAVGNHGEPFSEPETRAIRDHLAANPAALSLSYHTSGRYVLHGWTHTDERAPDSLAMFYHGGAIAESLVYPVGNGTEHYELLQGGRWYFTAGEYSDYVYHTHRTMAFTLEMWYRQNPDGSVIPEVVERNLEGFKTLMQNAQKAGITGVVTDAVSGAPLVAEISLPDQDDQGKLLPYYTDSLYGRYFRYLAPGNYRLLASLNGYRDQYIDVSVTEEELTVVNFEMEAGPLLQLKDLVILDNNEAGSSGNGNQKINIGEVIAVQVDLENEHAIGTEQVTALVKSSSPYVEFINDSLFFGNVEASGVVSSQNVLLFTLKPDCPDSTLLDFKIEVSDTVGIGWVLSGSAAVFAPELVLDQIVVVDDQENNNGVFEAGEQVFVDLTLQNLGRQTITGINALIETEDPLFELVQNQVAADNLLEGGALKLRFEVKLNEFVAGIVLGSFTLNLSSAEGYEFNAPFQLHNIQGYFNDFEQDVDVWQHASFRNTSNHHDDWQLGTPQGKSGDPESAYSGDRCWGNDLGYDWFLGESWNGSYQSSQHNYLESPVIDCSDLSGVGLRYMRLLTTLSNDVGRLYVNDSLLWESGRRGHSDIEWKMHEIDISDIADYNPEVVLRFELKSNNYGDAGGWNIDDLIVGANMFEPSSSRQADVGNNIKLLAYPNPGTSNFRIEYGGLPGSQAVLQIADAQGRMVLSQPIPVLQSRAGVYMWNGTNQNGQLMPAGVYSVMIHTDTASRTLSLIKTQ